MSYLRVDLKRFFRGQTSISGKIKHFILTPEIWSVVIYRAGSYLHNKKQQNHFWPSLLLPILTIVDLFVRVVTGIDLPFTVKIGKGLYIGHFGGIFINPKAVIGEYCNLSTGVIIGQAGRDGKQFTPVIGDRVYIAPGAKIIGKVKIGNDVAIGANAVVTKDIPDHAVVGGVPAKIINMQGSSDLIL